MADFKRFPQWMWRNSLLVEFAEWLGKYNDQFANDAMITGFYGLDLSDTARIRF